MNLFLIYLAGILVWWLGIAFWTGYTNPKIGRALELAMYGFFWPLLAPLAVLFATGAVTIAVVAVLPAMGMIWLGRRAREFQARRLEKLLEPGHGAI